MTRKQGKRKEGQGSALDPLRAAALRTSSLKNGCPEALGLWRVKGRALALAFLLSACASTTYNLPPKTLNETEYTAIYPYYVEFCALSETRKKKGSAVDIEGGGPGGHSVLYLNNVCRVRDALYPEIAVCDSKDGVGLSVNAHFSNANWIATEGRDFFWHGDLAPGEPVTQASYARTQVRAARMGILNGVTFHPEVLADKPIGMSDQDTMYELSVATDYAIGFGRDRYCARVPVDRPRMQSIVAYLNTVNAPYRSGQKTFDWDVLRNNCAHLTHNALAIVGLWPEWPIERSLLVAAFDFPVPKNEFVNLMRRINDLPISDPAAIYNDAATRDALLRQDWIATRPGGLAEAEPAIRPNAMYETKLRLIFFDEPIFGHYQERFEAIFTTPRYTDLRANLAHFATLYSRILTAPASTDPPAAFAQRYHDHIAAEKAELAAAMARLRAATTTPNE